VIAGAASRSLDEIPDSFLVVTVLQAEDDHNMPAVILDQDGDQ